MAATARNLSNGELAVFDDETRNLYLVVDPMDYSASAGADQLDSLIESGKARKFDAETLDSLSQALSKMVLLDCGHNTGE